MNVVLINLHLFLKSSKFIMLVAIKQLEIVIDSILLKNHERP